MELYKFNCKNIYSAKYLLNHFNLNDIKSVRLGSAVIAYLKEPSKESLQSFCYIGCGQADFVSQYDIDKFNKEFKSC